MNIAAQPVVHSARADAFQREATWCLGPDALEREGGEPAEAPWWAHLMRFYLRLIVPWAIRDIFLLSMVVLLVFVLALVGGVAITDLFLIKLGVVVAFIPVMMMYTRKNWPRSFDPAAIPAEALPGG